MAGLGFGPSEQVLRAWPDSAPVLSGVALGRAARRLAGRVARPPQHGHAVQDDDERCADVDKHRAPQREFAQPGQRQHRNLNTKLVNEELRSSTMLRGDVLKFTFLLCLSGAAPDFQDCHAVHNICVAIMPV